MRERHLDRYAALRAPDIDERPPRRPGKLLGDGLRGAHADARHGLEELFEAGRVAVENREEVSSRLHLVLRPAGAQAVGERTPKRVQPRVRHLEHPADVRGPGAVEEHARLRRVRIAAILTVEHAERHERIEEVPGAAWMQLQALAECLRVKSTPRELGEHAQLDRAEKHLRSPEPHAELDDARGVEIVAHLRLPWSDKRLTEHPSSSGPGDGRARKSCGMQEHPGKRPNRRSSRSIEASY
jgi:hypothetical protein